MFSVPADQQWAPWCFELTRAAQLGLPRPMLYFPFWEKRGRLAKSVTTGDELTVLQNAIWTGEGLLLNPGGTSAPADYSVEGGVCTLKKPFYANQNLTIWATFRSLNGVATFGGTAAAFAGDATHNGAQIRTQYVSGGTSLRGWYGRGSDGAAAAPPSSSNRPGSFVTIVSTQRQIDASGNVQLFVYQNQAITPNFSFPPDPQLITRLWIGKNPYLGGSEVTPPVVLVSLGVSQSYMTDQQVRNLIANPFSYSARAMPHWWASGQIAAVLLEGLAQAGASHSVAVTVQRLLSGRPTAEAIGAAALQVSRTLAGLAGGMTTGEAAALVSRALSGFAAGETTEAGAAWVPRSLSSHANGAAATGEAQALVTRALAGLASGAAVVATEMRVSRELAAAALSLAIAHGDVTAIRLLAGLSSGSASTRGRLVAAALVRIARAHLEVTPSGYTLAVRSAGYSLDVAPSGHTLEIEP